MYYSYNILRGGFHPISYNGIGICTAVEYSVLAATRKRSIGDCVENILIETVILCDSFGFYFAFIDHEYLHFDTDLCFVLDMNVCLHHAGGMVPL